MKKCLIAVGLAALVAAPAHAGETRAIEVLHPLRVLNNRVNVFIVLKEEQETQEGLYVVHRYFSYAPGMGDRFLVFERLSQPGDMAKGLYRCKLKKPEPTTGGDDR